MLPVFDRGDQFPRIFLNNELVPALLRPLFHGTPVEEKFLVFPLVLLASGFQFRSLDKPPGAVIPTPVNSLFVGKVIPFGLLRNAALSPHSTA